MPRFRVIHKSSREEWEVEAGDRTGAVRIVGWPKDVCKVVQLARGPYAKINPPLKRGGLKGRLSIVF